MQPKKGQKEHYNNGDNNVRQKSQSDVWMSRFRTRTRPIIPENSTGKHKGKGQDEFLGRNSTNSLLYYIYFY
jgi:hypothetical protein